MRVFNALSQTSWLLVCILLAFAGCIVGLNMVYTGKDYREIQWEPRKIYQDIIQANSDTSTSARAAKTQVFDSSFLKKKELIMNRVKLMPDSLFQVLYWKDKVRIDVDSIRTDASFTANLFKRADGTLPLIMNDSAVSRKVLFHHHKYSVRTSPATEFFARHPSFGIWALLIVSQLTLYFFLFPFAVFLLFTQPQDAQYRSWVEVNKKQRFLYLGFLLVALLVFFLLVIVKAQPVLPVLAMPNINLPLGVTNLIGYITIAVLLAAALGSLADAANYRTASDDAAQAAVAGIEAKVKSIFIITAVLLCLGILSTGALYNGMNSLSFIRQLNRDLGFTLFSADAPYLYGCIHSCILLVCFIPIRMRINALKAQVDLNVAAAKKTTEKADGATPQAAQPPISVDPSLIKKLTDLLIAGSPFLVGLLQSLFEQILK